jgi:hypothetical protein
MFLNKIPFLINYHCLVAVKPFRNLKCLFVILVDSLDELVKYKFNYDIIKHLKLISAPTDIPTAPLFI